MKHVECRGMWLLDPAGYWIALKYGLLVFLLITLSTYMIFPIQSQNGGVQKLSAAATIVKRFQGMAGIFFYPVPI